jgi:Uma2 family endonuclease
MGAVLQNQEQKEWTAEEFFNSHLSKDHELVEGQAIKTMPAGFLHGAITNRLSYFLSAFVIENNLGIVLAAETGFILGEKIMRGADAAFVSNEKLARFGIPEGFFPAAPDLAVEVASPSNSSEELLSKVDEYIKAGSRLVWILNPKRKIIYVHHLNNVINVLHETDVLRLKCFSHSLLTVHVS